MSRISSFVIFILIFSHIVNLVNCINTINTTNEVDFWGSTKSKLTFKESNGSYFEIRRAFTFENDVVVQIIYPTDLVTYCLDPSVYLWVNYENGTITPFRVDFSFPAYNFCPGPSGFYSLEIIRLDSDKLLIQYVNSTDVNSASFYGLVVGKEGNIIRFVIALISMVKKIIF